MYNIPATILKGRSVSIPVLQLGGWRERGQIKTKDFLHRLLFAMGVSERSVFSVFIFKRKLFKWCFQEISCGFLQH